MSEENWNLVLLRDLAANATMSQDRRKILDWAAAEIDSLKARVEELTRERDLAIAHDRQPYPTVEAYEKVCEVLAQKRVRVEELEGLLRRHGSHEDHCNTIMGWEKPYRPPLQCDCVLAEFMSPLEADDA